MVKHNLQEAKSGELKPCSGRCKAIVRRIIGQVKAETEQWSQMQKMLSQVREEMEELQASRDFWEAQALESEQKIQTMTSDVRLKTMFIFSKVLEFQLRYILHYSVFYLHSS